MRQDCSIHPDIRVPGNELQHLLKWELFPHLMFDHRGPETAVWIGLSLNSCVHLQWTGNGVRRILNFAVYRNGDLSRVCGVTGYSSCCRDCRWYFFDKLLKDWVSSASAYNTYELRTE
ncbi:hypothetical protein MFRU_005g02690 [Monilinia fructicola]|nr:hypothetical protein MFRU_005g02690 [Monilinia fructicola]